MQARAAARRPGDRRSTGAPVGVVVVPPPIGRRPRIALGRVLPFLLAPERGDVEVAPGAAHRLVAAAVDEVGTEDPVAVADEGVVAVPLVHAEVGVEVVRDRVPGDQLPAHPFLQALDLRLGGARDERERRLARVQVCGVRDLVGHKGAADAGPLRVPAARLRVRGDVRRVEGAVDDQLAAAVEQVEQAGRAIRAVELVLLLHGHPRHPATRGGERVAGPHVLLLLHEQVLPRGDPLLHRDDRWRFLQSFSSFTYSSTTSNSRPQRARWRSIQSAASLSTPGSSESRCVRPITSRLTTPVSSSTFRCFVIAGLETPNPSVASPTVAGQAASRSTMPRRIGWESALNESLTTGLTVARG